MRIAFFGSSLVSAYWNGAATYYRGITRALAARGHQITFYEPDAYDRQSHRDIPDPDWARVVVYETTTSAVAEALQAARANDVLIKCSGVGVFDEFLERAVVEFATSERRVGFCDVDAPATLDRLLSNPHDPFHELIPRFDFVFTYGGGEPVCSRYRELGARHCVPIYNALDPSEHHPVEPEPKFSGTLGFLANRLPDRESRVDEFFLATARALPQHRFILGGSGWSDKPYPPNVAYVGHVYTADHNAFNCSPLAVLNVHRSSMAHYGYSPATRVFEAAGAGACIITDAFEGIELFLEPDREVLVARNTEDVIRHIQQLDRSRAERIGQRARRRVLTQHTYDRRAEQLEALLEGRTRESTLRHGRTAPTTPVSRTFSEGAE